MRTIRVLVAVALWVLCAGLTVVAIVFWFDTTAEPDVGAILTSSVLLLFPTGGVILVRRSPGNPFGPMFLGLGLAWGTGLATSAFIESQIVTGNVTGTVADLVVWVGLWTGPLAFASIPIMLLLFPTGRPASPIWRHASRFATASLVLITMGFAFAPGTTGEFASLDNPYGIAGAEWIQGLIIVGWFGLLISVALGTLSLIVRFIRGTGEERQQLKWVLFAAAILVASSFAWGVSEEFGGLVTALGMAALPIAITIAILKYRLYDIDVVINRALVYGSLTATLGLIYGGIVTAASVLVGESDVAVAAATLAVAGAFRPLRIWVQDFIDRRFYRRKFDAQRTIEDFSHVVRNAIDLPTLTDELALVVNNTMHPRSVSLWIRPDVTK